MFVDLLYDTNCKAEAQYLENIWRQKIANIIFKSIYDTFRNTFPSDVIYVIHGFLKCPKPIIDLRRTHHFLTLNMYQHPVYGYYIEEYIG